MSEHKQLREKLRVILLETASDINHLQSKYSPLYYENNKNCYIAYKVEQILAAIEEGITSCIVCAGLGISNPSDFREDKPILIHGLCPNCGGKGWVMK